MFTKRTGIWSAMALAAVAMFAFAASPAWSRGGGGGGGHAGGGYHGGGHANPHPYHPSENHYAHHADGNHGDYNHHYNGWHNGYWGAAGLGYGLGYAAGYAPWGWGGDYDGTVDDDDVMPVYNDPDYATVQDMTGVYEGDNTADTSGGANVNANANPATGTGFPTDTWPELGISTYAGQYGGTQGQVIVRIVPGSAAAKAGFVPGDVILTFNGQPTASADQLEQQLESAKGQFSAEVWDARTGRQSTVSGDLDANGPAPAPSPSSPTAAVSQQ